MDDSQLIREGVSPFKSGEARPGMEAIILAGGLGTRLRSVITDLPKCMAPIAGKPFLHYVIQYLQKQGINKFIFSLGYLSDHIETLLLTDYTALNYQLSVEKEPLGTGGAILLAVRKAAGQNVLIVNGDTFFSAGVNAITNFHFIHDSACTLALKPMQKFDRYGAVTVDENNRIISFREKQFYQRGLINGGMYVLNREKFLAKPFPEKFSFEKDYLEKYVSEKQFFGTRQDEYFIDIGIPEDFERAQKELINFQF